MNEWPEILLIDKPLGLTSFDVIRRLRRKYSDSHEGEKAPKMGHAGTLDPLASGLMIIGVGQGTKKLNDLIKLDKEYVAEVLIGKKTTTGDMEGEVVEEVIVKEDVEILQSKISTELTSMIGTITLPVSVYSAIKKAGIPMYKRAREAEKTGEVIKEIPVRDMKIYEAELLDVYSGDGFAIATIRFSVASGTYIRSLGEELGKRINYPATLQNLRRTKVGEFDIKDSEKL